MRLEFGCNVMGPRSVDGAVYEFYVLAQLLYIGR
jgi:hypothetical protein